MRRLTLITLSLVAVLFHGIATAEDNAVSSVNGEVAVLWGKYKNDDLNWDGSTKSFGVQGNIPLGKYFGLSAVAQGGNLQSSSGPNVDYDFTFFSASPFWRDPKLGLVGVTVGRAKFDFNSPSSQVKTNTKALNASAYLGPVTLSVLRERDEVTDGSRPDSNDSWTDLVWYPAPDFLLDLSVGAQDVKKNYSLAFEHQLAGLPSLSYGLIYAWDNSQYSSSAWYVTVTYKFAEKKSLMRRNREDLFGPR